MKIIVAIIITFLLITAAFAEGGRADGWTDEQKAKYPKKYEFLTETSKTHKVLYHQAPNAYGMRFDECKAIYLQYSTSALTTTELLVHDDEYLAYTAIDNHAPDIIHDIVCDKERDDVVWSVLVKKI